MVFAGTLVGSPKNFVIDFNTATLGETGPLTDWINVDAFSDFIVPIDEHVLLGVIGFCVLLAAHEAYVAAGAKPLLANHEQRNSVPLQVVIVLSWILMFMNVAMLVPVSLDFSLAMGQSATASGVFLSGGSVFSVVGVVLGKPLTSEAHWNQQFARRLFLVCNLLRLLASKKGRLAQEKVSHHFAQYLRNEVFVAPAFSGILFLNRDSCNANIMLTNRLRILPRFGVTFWDCGFGGNGCNLEHTYAAWDVLVGPHPQWHPISSAQIFDCV